jgi:hypothetical protein
MAGPVPAIPVFVVTCKKGVDARHKAGHDILVGPDIRERASGLFRLDIGGADHLPPFFLLQFHLGFELGG